MKKNAWILFFAIGIIMTGCHNRQPEVAEEAIVQEENRIEYDFTVIEHEAAHQLLDDMIVNPQNYEGKKLRIEGVFSSYQIYDENGEPIPEQRYYSCIIADVGGCGVHEIEFVRDGVYSYPQDFPQERYPIMVTGIFDVYETEGHQYIRLTDAELRY